MKKISATYILMSFLISIISLANLNAQEPIVKTEDLKTGQILPDYKLINLINYPVSSARFSDFAGKLLILDFWGTHCAACVQSWPRLLALQKEFEGKIQFITVNDMESTAVIKQFIERRKQFANVNMTLPVSCGDSAIEKVFPYSSVPYIVWIDESGKFKVATYGSSLTRKNILDHLNKKPMQMLPVIDDNDLIRWNPFKPVFVNNGGLPEKIYGQSVFAKADNRLFPQMPVISAVDTQAICLAAGNACIRDLYSIAYSDKLLTNMGYKYIERPVVAELLNNRILLQFKDSTSYVNIIDGNYRYDKNYTYQLLSAHKTIPEMQEYMKVDLKRFVGLSVQWKNIRKKCWVLSADKSNNFKYTSGDTSHLMDISMVAVNNMLMSSFIYQLERTLPGFSGPYPLINETHFKGRIGNINGTGDFTNIEELAKVLRKSGLLLSLKERVVKVLVLSDKPQVLQKSADN